MLFVVVVVVAVVVVVVVAAAVVLVVLVAAGQGVETSTVLEKLIWMDEIPMMLYYTGENISYNMSYIRKSDFFKRDSQDKHIWSVYIYI